MDFEIILQECFLGDPLPKLLEEFHYAEQNGCQGYKLKYAFNDFPCSIGGQILK